MKNQFYASLKKGKEKNGIALIAEIKKASPSAGILNNSLDVVRQAQIYESSGASAISVLTESKRFNGSFKDLKRVSSAVSIPTVCKDFITKKDQIEKAQLCGASAILLIVRNLNDEKLHGLFTFARGLDLEVLVETHTEKEIERAVKMGARIIGVNARNLETFEIDTTIFKKLLPLIPDTCIKIAESGIETRKDVLFAKNCGTDATLVGTAIMKSRDPKKTIYDLGFMN